VGECGNGAEGVWACARGRARRLVARGARGRGSWAIVRGWWEGGRGGFSWVRGRKEGGRVWRRGALESGRGETLGAFGVLPRGRAVWGHVFLGTMGGGRGTGGEEGWMGRRAAWDELARERELVEAANTERYVAMGMRGAAGWGGGWAGQSNAERNVAATVGARGLCGAAWAECGERRWSWGGGGQGGGGGEGSRAERGRDGVVRRGEETRLRGTGRWGRRREEGGESVRLGGFRGWRCGWRLCAAAVQVES
jgi:hypothetical protein